MASQYPATIDNSITLPLVSDNVNSVSASAVNNLRNAIVQMEQALGVNPAGIYGTVLQRLNAVDASISNITYGVNIPITTTGISYTALNTDVLVGATAGSITITLPLSPTTGKTITVKDINGVALGANITVFGNGVNIDGSSTYVINQNYGVLRVAFTGSKWSII